MYTIIYGPDAENDLVEILTYYAEAGGIRLAETMNMRIKTQIERLKHMPQRIADSQLVPGVKGFLIEKLPYWAYFVIDEEHMTVFILNVVHTRRKFASAKA